LLSESKGYLLIGSKYLVRATIPKKQILLLGGDILLIVASFYYSPMIRFGVYLDPVAVFGYSDIVALFVYLLGLYIFNFYNLEEDTYTIYYALRFTSVILAVNLINSSLYFIFHLRPHSSGIIAISGISSCLLLLGWRIAITRYLNVRRKPLKLLIMGAGRTGRTLYDSLITTREYEVVGFLDDDDKKKGIFIGDAPVLGNSALLLETVKEKAIDKIIVAISRSIRPDVFQGLVQAKFNGVSVYEMPTFYEKVTGKIPVLHTSEMWLGYADISGVKRNVYNIRIKKVFDKFLSLVGLMLSSPILLITTLLIKVDSPGPVLYRQKRVGWDEKEFSLVKFRSMRMDAETNGAVWAQVDDARVTQVGRWIRRLRIDELPQLWNVLKGDMSFVGPRPERMEFVKDLERDIPFYSLRHSVRPGITGWAQVNYPYGASTQDALEKLQYDLYYIKNLSPLLDLQIFLRTFYIVLFLRGAR
jgi:sugar transferase (PEP-CTERM system associated)